MHSKPFQGVIGGNHSTLISLYVFNWNQDVVDGVTRVYCTATTSLFLDPLKQKTSI